MNFRNEINYFAKMDVGNADFKKVASVLTDEFKDFNIEL